MIKILSSLETIITHTVIIVRILCSGFWIEFVDMSSYY